MTKPLARRIGFIGTGAITDAMVRGLLASPPAVQAVMVSARNAQIAARLAADFPAFAVSKDNQAIVDGCESVVLAIRPQIAEEVVRPLRFRDGQTVIVPNATCGVQMFGQLGDAMVECPACGTRYRVATRKRWMLDAVREVWERPAAIVKALGALDLDLTQGRLDTWISRDRERHERRCWPGEPCDHILQRGLDSDEVDEDGRALGRPVYRIGDVIARVDRLRAEREARADEAEAAS